MESVKEEKTCFSNKTERSWKSEECFAIRHGDADFRDCTAVFQSFFGPVFPHYAPFPMFWNGNVYPVPLYVGIISSAF